MGVERIHFFVSSAANSCVCFFWVFRNVIYIILSITPAAVSAGYMVHTLFDEAIQVTTSLIGDTIV